MNGKKVCAIALLGLFSIGLYFLAVGWAYLFPFLILLVGAFGCFVVAFAVYAFSTRATLKTLFFLITLLISLWIGGFYIAVGIAAEPSMGMISAYVGIFFFVVIWVIYAVNSWFIVPFVCWITNQFKHEKVKKAIKSEKKTWLLNTWQWRAFWVGVFVIILMGVIPPYQDQDTQHRFRVFIGFWWGVNEIEYTMLFLQWAIVALITSAVIYALKHRAKKTPTDQQKQ
ncbi:MAG: hypothetical protein ACYS0I_14465 [Planctomycetota bacterium]|jgi:hypothetical protein